MTTPAAQPSDVPTLLVAASNTLRHAGHITLAHVVILARNDLAAEKQKCAALADIINDAGESLYCAAKVAVRRCAESDNALNNLANALNRFDAAVQHYRNSNLRQIAAAEGTKYGTHADGSPRTQVQAMFGDGVTPSMHRKLERYLRDTGQSK